MSTKEKIVEALLAKIEQNSLDIQSAMEAAKDARDSESKSSVGDKYETGRAMAQLEMEKLSEQLSQVAAQRNTLLGLDLKRSHSQVDIGSLVETNQGTYYVAIGLGKVEIDDSTIFVISLSSPVGQELFNKKCGDEVRFMKKTISIISIE